jgi:hypothetical protein
MKIKEVVNEGFMDTVKAGAKLAGQGLVGAGKLGAQAVGATAMAGLRGLDKLGGGTGQVGTPEQVAAYNAKQAAKNKTSAYDVKVIRGAGNPHEGMVLLMGADHYTINLSTGQWVDEHDSPLSAKFQDMFYDAGLKAAPKNVELLAGKQAWDVTKTKPASSTSTPTSVPTGPLIGTGVTVIHSSPLVLQYKKQDFMLNPQDQWVNVVNGKAVNPALAQFLQAQADKL